MYFGVRVLILAGGVALMPHFAEAQSQPRVSRYTAMSALRIQEAQSMEGDSLQEEVYREALESVYGGLRNESDNPEGYLHLGIVHLGLGNYLAADSAFDQAEAMYPDYVDEENGTGVYRFNGWIEAYTEATEEVARNPEGALELFNVANMLFDKRPEGYLNIGAQAAGLGDLEGSIEAWRSAIAVIESPEADAGDDETRRVWDTDFWTMSYTNLGRVLEMAQRPEEAIAAYRTLLERYPDDVQARSSLALALTSVGQEDDALTIFDEILAREDGNPLDFFNAGASLYQADQLEKAAIGFQKALERSPMYRDALQNLIQSLSVLEDYEAQISFSEKLLELDPHNEYVYQLYIRALVQMDRQVDGVAALEVMRGLPFATDNLQLSPMNSGAIVSGVAINKTLPPGTSITLRFTSYDDDGNPLGTVDTEVTLSDPDVTHQFQVTFEEETQVLGYGYEFVN
jgi:tetratricopeptide (TPR) repeat protein